MLQDIQHGHGVFFLDPHGDAIDDVYKRNLHKDGVVFILDPQDETHSFGINLLSCRDTNSLKERVDTYTRAYDVFNKLWKKEWGPWLQLILQHTLYVFTENPGYTLADLPLFLTPDPAFRNHLLRNVKHNQVAVDFWRQQFAEKRDLDQQRQVDAALTRITTLLGHPYVRHIVGQQQTTVDFSEIMEKRRILLVKLSANLPDDIKTFIGTILLSELLRAVRRRETIPVEKRHQFCIFIDEFQNFASSDDLGTLITEGRKFGIATTISHQERFGQLAANPEMLGATAAAANKVCFQLTVTDAQELAPEFASRPPTETRREQQLVLSHEPMTHLLRGHDHPYIRSFVHLHLRPLHEQIEDTKATIEGERLVRLDYLDAASLLHLTERRERLNENYVASFAALQNAMRTLLLASGHTAKLQDLTEQLHAQQQAVRELNAFFTAVMEGRVAPGQEEFSDFLIARARDTVRVPPQHADLLALFISLHYGDPDRPRTIPFALAHKHQVFTDLTARLAQETAEQTRREQEAVREQYVTQRLARWIKTGADEKQRKHEERLAELEKNYPYWRGGGPEMEFWTVPEIYTRFVWLQCYSSLRELLVPYYTARFRYPRKGNLKTIASSQKSLWDVPLPELIRNIGPYLHPGEETAERFHEYLRPSVVRQLEIFLTLHGEGAFVVQELLYAAERGGWQQQDVDFNLRTRYENRSMVSFPRIAGKDPLAILRLIKQINDFMHQNKNGCLELLAYFDHRAFIPITLKELVFKSLKIKTYDIEDPARFIAELKRANIYPLFSPNSLDLEEALTRGRTDMHRLKTLLSEQWDGFSRQHPTAAAHWTRCDSLAQVYLIARACDLILFREVSHPAGCVANATFPLPAVPGAEAIVSALVSFSQETEARLQKAADEKRLAEHREWLEQECAKELTKITVRPPETLTPPKLSAQERAALMDACRNELSQSEPARLMLRVIADVVKFCELLSRPENHIFVPSGQYVERQVNTRSVDDMTNEMRQTLLNLPRFSAYVKLIQERDGKQVVLKRRIKTFPLPPISLHSLLQETAEVAAPAGSEEILHAASKRILAASRHAYCRPRAEIEEEIRQRQDAWRPAAQTPPPPGQF